MEGPNDALSHLDPEQTRRFHEVWHKFVVPRRDEWIAVDTCDHKGFRDFSDQWFDAMFTSCCRPGSTQHITVKASLVRRAADDDVKDEDDSSDELEDFGQLVACSSRNDDQFEFRAPPGGLGRALAQVRRQATMNEEDCVLRVFLKHAKVSVKTVDDVLHVVDAAARGATGRFTMRANMLRVEDGVVGLDPVTRAMQQRQIFFAEAASRAVGIARPKRAQGGAGDDDVDDEGGEGGRLTDLGDVARVDVHTWLVTAPVQLRTVRLVDGVLTEERGIVSSFEADTTARLPGSSTEDEWLRAGGALIQVHRGPTQRSDARVTVLVDGKRAGVSVQPSRTALPAAGWATVRLGCSTPGIVKLKLTVTDGSDLTHSIRVKPPPSLQPDKPLIIAHKASANCNLFREHGLSLPQDLCAGLPFSSDANRVAAFCTGPAVALTGSLARGMPRAEAIAEFEKRLVRDVADQVRRKEAEIAGVSLDDIIDSSEESDDGAEKRSGAASKASAFAQYMSNSHMLPRGVDLRRPFTPQLDPRTTVLQPLGQRRPKRYR